MNSGGTAKSRIRLPATLALVLGLALLSGPALAEDKVAPPLLPGDRNVTLSTRDMDLAAFLELLSVSYKLNIVPPKDLAGKVTVNFHDVPPLDALKAVLEANGYYYTLEQTVGQPIIKIKITPKVEGSVPLTVQSFVLKYATAADVAKVSEGLLSKNGSAVVAPGRNAIIVQDLSDNIQRIEEVVKLLDTAPRQVMIDAKLVELSHSDTEGIGFDWSMFQSMNIADITAETSYARTAAWTQALVSGSPDSNTRNIVRTTGTNVNLRGGVLDENNASLVLDFFDSQTNSTIISRPSIRTLDNRPAHIISGQIVPIPLFDFAKDTGVRTLSGFQDEQIGIELTVTPHLNDDGFITLDVNPKVESIDRYITVGGDAQRPVRNTRQATTAIRIKDGGTAVIGGLTSATTTETTTGLPFFKDIPLIGFLFRSKANSIVNNELIIFITTRSVKDDEPLTDREKELVKSIDAIRVKH